MSLWSRILNVVQGNRLNREIDEELRSHIEEAIEQGRDPVEARRAFGSALHQRERSRDVKLIPWLDSLHADVVFGWRMLRKHKVTSVAAILSLALAIGACTSAFRLIDAVLLRPLPIAEPEQLYEVGSQVLDHNGTPFISSAFAYPLFQQLRAVLGKRGDLIAISSAGRVDLTYGSDQEMEKAYRQYVSGWMFSSFGLRSAVGRLLTENDDLKPKAHPYAVLSCDYWTRRFGQDPAVVGRKMRFGNEIYVVVGVVGRGFTGTQPGTMTDIFVPATMHPGATHADWSWFRTFLHLKPGVAIEPLHAQLHATMMAFNQDMAKGFANDIPKEALDRFLNQKLVLEPAAAGASGMQENYRQALVVLGGLVALVLLIACANVANLMTAQASARAREMALRVSIGAGRWRLVQLVLVQSAWVGLLAAGVGGVFAWWSAPFVVGMINPPDNPARLVLPADWRVLGFMVTLALGVTFLFGLAPALRASSVKPVSALKGGEDPHSRRRLMHALVAVQVAFCFLVLFVAGLFVATFDRLANQPNGFSTERLLTLDAHAEQPQLPVYWDQVAEQLRRVPGVEAVALCGWPLLDGSGWNGFISINAGPMRKDLAYFLNVSPGWIDVMKIHFIEGRDLRASDTTPGVAIVNETFAKTYFDGKNPIGRTFEKTQGGHETLRFEIVGLVGDARYRNVRESIPPTAYVSFRALDAKGVERPQTDGTFIVRTSSANPLTLASILRQEVPRARTEFRVTGIRTQKEINESQTVRERLLATLALFFAGVALLLATVGLYGVLRYSVLQRQREIAIRMALGARAGRIARGVTVTVFSMVFVGAIAGLGLGMASVRYIESLFYQVKATDALMLALPSLTLFVAALLAALPPVIRAVRVDPVTILRAE